MLNTNPNPFWFLVMMVITVFIVIMSCANVAHSHNNSINNQQIYYSDNYYQHDYRERYHVPKRIRYHVQERYHVPKRIRYHAQERYYVNYELCRIQHNHSICREGHVYGYERPLSHRERYMRNRVIREGGEW